MPCEQIISPEPKCQAACLVVAVLLLLVGLSAAVVAPLKAQQARNQAATEAAIAAELATPLPVVAPPDAVTEGVGIEQLGLVLGLSSDQVTQLLGPPDDLRTWDSRFRMWDYRKSRGIDVFTVDNKAEEIRLNKGWPHPLGSGVRIGSHTQLVFRAYGAPIRTEKVGRITYLREDRVLYARQGAKAIKYAQRGVLFWFGLDDEVVQYVVFKPYTPKK